MVVAQVEARENNVNAMILSKDCAVDNDGTALHRNDDHDNERDRIKYIEENGKEYYIEERENSQKINIIITTFSLFLM